jgi:hypothetical protein
VIHLEAARQTGWTTRTPCGPAGVAEIASDITPYQALDNDSDPGDTACGAHIGMTPSAFSTSTAAG